MVRALHLFTTGLFVAVMYFNITSAMSMWGMFGGFLAVVAFPFMLVAVPVGLLVEGDLPYYGLLVPIVALFFGVARLQRQRS